MQVIGSRDLEVEDTISTSSSSSNAQRLFEKKGHLWTSLRHVERQRYSKWETSVALSNDGDIEAALTFDESRDVVTEVTWDSIQPVRVDEPFLLIVRTGRIITAHVALYRLRVT